MRKITCTIAAVCLFLCCSAPALCNDAIDQPNVDPETGTVISDPSGSAPVPTPVPENQPPPDDPPPPQQEEQAVPSPPPPAASDNATPQFDGQPGGDAPPGDAPPLDSEGQPQAEPAVEKVIEQLPVSDAQQTANGSVLDRFRAYRGDKTAAIMIALFTLPVSAAMEQEPPIVVSDGVMRARITLKLDAAKDSSPNFTLTRARMVSLAQDEAGRWILDVIPVKNALRASITVVNGSSGVEFPLTVVPPAVIAVSDDEGFAGFLKDGDAKPPKYDLNGDGRHDYLDDYIYTAHYLIRKNTTQELK